MLPLQADAELIVPASFTGIWETTNAPLTFLTFASPTANYLAGNAVRNSSVEQRNYFVFDLSAVTEDVAAAELRLSLPNQGFFSTDPVETYRLYDVSTPIDGSNGYLGGVNIPSSQGTQGSLQFDDVGTGVSFGSIDVSNSDNGSILSVHLNVDGISAINTNRGGLFAIGGAVTTLDLSRTTEQEFVFGFSGFQDIRQLVLSPIPEPEIYAMMLAGLGVLGFIGRPRRKAT